MKNLTFCAVVAFLIVLMQLVYGCGGTRNTELSKNTLENINIENSYSMGEKIVLNDIFTYTPLDISKPMVLNGKSYQNAVVKSDKSILKEKKIETRTKYNITKTIVIHKTTDKTNYIYLWLGFGMIIAISALCYLVLKKWGFV